MNIVFDFDSTLIKTEGLEELAAIALEHHPDKELLLENIIRTTEQGMKGEISFQESLTKRLNLLSPTLDDIKKLNSNLVNKISDSVMEHKDFFKENSSRIFIVSGGFLNFIHPVTDFLGLPREHVFANTFNFYGDKVIGFDSNNPLSMSEGKPEVIRRLLLSPSEVTVVGDGYTDYEIKEKGLASRFFLYTENVRRENLEQFADKVVKNITELRSFL